MTREPRKGEFYEPVPGWDSAYQQIVRMRRRGEITLVPCKVHGRTVPQVPRLLILPKDNAPSYQKWQHEISRGDCYVALHKTGKVTGYRSRWSKDEYKTFSREHGVNFDSHFDLHNSRFTFFLELDMGTEYWDDEIDKKVTDYAALAQSMPQHPFYVLFIATSRSGLAGKDRLKAFGRCFEQHGRGQNFLVTELAAFLNDPLGPIFASERFNKAVSLQAL